MNIDPDAEPCDYAEVLEEVNAYLREAHEAGHLTSAVLEAIFTVDAYKTTALSKLTRDESIAFYKFYISGNMTELKKALDDWAAEQFHEMEGNNGSFSVSARGSTPTQ